MWETALDRGGDPVAKDCLDCLLVAVGSKWIRDQDLHSAAVHGSAVVLDSTCISVDFSVAGRAVVAL